MCVYVPRFEEPLASHLTPPLLGGRHFLLGLLVHLPGVQVEGEAVANGDVEGECPALAGQCLA